MRSQMLEQLHDQLYAKLGERLDTKFYDQLRGQLRLHLHGQLYAKLGSRLLDQVLDQLMGQLHEQIIEATK